MTDLLLTLCALVAWYCFFRAAILLPSLWRGLKAWWDEPPYQPRAPYAPPPPDPAWVAEQQRRMNLAHKYRNAKERRLNDAR